MAVLIHRSRSPRHGTLWQGSADDVMKDNSKFDLIILCAEEFQPEASLIASAVTKVVHAPNDDSENPFTRSQLDAAVRATRAVHDAYLSGKNVLISCMAGRNRSGLVTALTLHLLFGLSGQEAREFIRAKVPHALTNPHFNRFLDGVRPRKTRARAQPRESLL